MDTETSPQNGGPTAPRKRRFRFEQITSVMNSIGTALGVRPADHHQPGYRRAGALQPPHPRGSRNRGPVHRGLRFSANRPHLKVGRLTRSDVFLNWLEKKSPRLQHMVQGIYHLVGAVLMVILFKASLPLSRKPGSWTFMWVLKGFHGARMAGKTHHSHRLRGRRASIPADGRKEFMAGMGPATKAREDMEGPDDGSSNRIAVHRRHSLFNLRRMHVAIALTLLSFLGVWFIRASGWWPARCWPWRPRTVSPVTSSGWCRSRADGALHIGLRHRQGHL